MKTWASENSALLRRDGDCTSDVWLRGILLLTADDSHRRTASIGQAWRRWATWSELDGEPTRGQDLQVPRSGEHPDIAISRLPIIPEGCRSAKKKGIRAKEATDRLVAPCIDRGLDMP